jgi:hypothetical protein
MRHNIILGLLLSLFMSVSGLTANGQCVVQDLNASTGYGWYGGVSYVGQTFTAGCSGDITQVKFSTDPALYGMGSIGFYGVTVSFYTGIGGTLLGSVSTSGNAAIGLNTLSVPPGITLTGATSYYMEITRTGGGYAQGISVDKDATYANGTNVINRNPFNPYDLTFSVAIAPTIGITTGTIAGSPFCAGSNVTIPYTSSGSFSGSFTAQLSDAAGSFGSPVNLTTVSTTSGSITATIPVGTAYGTGYRIRVVNSNPATNGSDNGAGLTIYSKLQVNPAVSPLYPMPGQEAQTIYLNYPGSATADTIKANASGGSGNYTYSWQKSNCSGAIMSPLNSGGSPVTASKYGFAPTNADTCSFFGDNVYTFTVKVSDGVCPDTTITKKINVVNAWVGDAGSSNVQICHKVPRSTLTQILQVAPSLVASHLGHGDILANCPVFIGKQILPGEQDEEEVHSAYIYPNPTNGIFMLELNEITSDQANITVTDISGKIIQARSISKNDPKTATFDMSSFAKGIYLIQVADGEFLYHDKIVVQ